MDDNNILIIGGGIAGLTAGIYAQKSGFNATIIEMHDKPGGQLTAWDRQGYRFDYCLHWLVGTDHGTYYDIWREIDAINEEVEVINHRTFVKIEDEDYGAFYIYNDLDEWENYLLEMAPEDEKGIKKMCRLMRRGDRLDQFEDAPGMRSVFDYLKAVIQMGGFFGTLLKYQQKSTKELFEELGFKNEQLQFFLNRLFGGSEFSAIAFIVMFGWFHAKNAGYLMGGSFEMTNRLAKKFQDLGGQFRFNSRVKEILIDKEKEESDEVEGVVLENGEMLYCDHLISACDGRTVLFDMLKGKYLPKATKKLIRSGNSLHRLSWFPSVLMIIFNQTVIIPIIQLKIFPLEIRR